MGRPGSERFRQSSCQNDHVTGDAEYIDDGAATVGVADVARSVADGRRLPEKPENSKLLNRGDDD